LGVARTHDWAMQTWPAPSLHAKRGHRVWISADGSHSVAVLPSQRQVQGADGPHAAPPYVHVPPTHAFSTQ
jgi:hypothetical protein